MSEESLPSTSPFKADRLMCDLDPDTGTIPWVRPHVFVDNNDEVSIEWHTPAKRSLVAAAPFTGMQCFYFAAPGAPLREVGFEEGYRALVADETDESVNTYEIAVLREQQRLNGVAIAAAHLLRVGDAEIAHHEDNVESEARAWLEATMRGTFAPADLSWWEIVSGETADEAIAAARAYAKQLTEGAERKGDG